MTVALREQCQRAVLAALQKRDWQLVDSTDAFVQAVVREAGAQPSSDRIQLAIVRCYGAVLYAACCGENFWRRNRAFQELGAYVYPIVRRRLHHVDEVADARQQVLLKVWQHRAECREAHSFLHWVALIAQNVCRDVARERFTPGADQTWQQRVITASDLRDGADERWERARPLWIPSARMEDPAMRARVIEALQHCLAGSEAQQRVIIETFLNDRSVKAIADLMQTTTDNVFVLRSRAVKTLRACEEFVGVLEDWLEQSEENRRR